MQLSVIILNYNVRYFLEQCVLSVQNAIATLDAEIIVVDNNSSDDSCLMIKNRFPTVILIENKENSGFPKGNNIGVNRANGTYICILNPDTVVAETTFIKMLAFADKQTNLGIIGCKLIDGTGNFLPESKRGIPTPFVAFTKITGLYKLFPKQKALGKYYAQHLNENQTGAVEILVGAFMFLQRNLYLELGGFDENCFMYSDDIDLSYLVLQSGKTNFYFHETTVIHYKGESTIKDALYMKRFQEAMHFFYKKHFKVSFTFNVFLTIGAFLFSLNKKSQAVTPFREVSYYVLISEDEKLKIQLEKLLVKKVERIAIAQIKDIISLIEPKKNIEIILDNTALSFQTIIATFEHVKNSNVTFKIFPKDSTFCIGSNNSSDRGVIINLNNAQ